MKRESELTSDALAAFLKLCPGALVLQQATAGAPDRVIAYNRRMTSWEFKHGTPDFVSLGNQELFCMRLAVQAHCRYVVWQESASGHRQRTLIVHPRDVHERNGWQFTEETSCIGHNHTWLAIQMRKAHGL